MERFEWSDYQERQWRLRAIALAARVERAVHSDVSSIEPVVGRLNKPTLSKLSKIAAQRSMLDLIALVSQLPDGAPHPDKMLSTIYDDQDVSLTQRCLLRALVVDAFSHSSRKVEFGSTNGVEMPIVNDDIFFLPAYGDPRAALKVLTNRSSLARLCALVENSGFVGDHSVALLSVPLSVASAHSIRSLKAIVEMVSSVESVNIEGQKTESSRSEPSSATIKQLSDFVPQAKGAFLIAGVRVRNVFQGDNQEVSDPLCDHMDLATRTVKSSWWKNTVSRILIEAGVRATDLVLRPPASPIKAQAQARAQEMVHEIYDRLAGHPFVRLDFEQFRKLGSNSSASWLGLSAFDITGTRLTTTRPASLFEVGLGEDFQDVLHEECRLATHRPATMNQQELLEDYLVQSLSDGRMEMRRVLGRTYDRIP